MSKKLDIALIILAIFWLSVSYFYFSGEFQAEAAGSTYYVKTNGNNSNNGLSWDTAWQTIDYGTRRLSAGDTLLVADGTYNENQIGRQMASGTAANKITIKANGNNAVINSTSHSFWFPSSADYIVIDGFKIHPDGSCIILYFSSDDSHGLTIKNNYCYGGNITFEDASYENSSGGYLIQNNYVENGIIGIGGGYYDSQILDNYIYVNGGEGSVGIGVGDAYCDSSTVYTNNILVSGNTIIDITGSGGHAGSVKKSRNVTYSNNIWYNTWDAVVVWGYDHSENITLDHNTVIS